MENPIKYGLHNTVEVKQKIEIATEGYACKLGINLRNIFFRFLLSFKNVFFNIIILINGTFFWYISKSPLIHMKSNDSSEKFCNIGRHLD